MRTAFYIRVSTLKDEQESSIPHQISQLESYAKINGLQIVDIIIDKVSGSKTTIQERKGTRKLLEMAQEHSFDVLLAKSVSRIGRDTVENLTLKRLLELNDIKIIAIQEGLDTANDEDEFLYTLHSSLAQSYSKKLGKDVKAGQIEKAKKGGWNSPWTPYGYKWDGEKLIKDEKEKYTLEKIFEYLKLGYGIRSTARLLNECEECDKGRKGSGWSPNSISHISKNPVYYGAIIFNNKIQTESGLHEPYITKEEYKQIQRFRRQGFSTGSKPSALLIGVARCGYCGSSVSMIKRENKTGEYRYYQCNAYSRKGRVACVGFHKRETEVDHAILDWLEKFIFSQNIDISQYIEEDNTDKELKEIEEQLNKNTDFYIKQTELLIEGKISEELYNKALEKIKEKETMLRKRKESLKNNNKLDIKTIESIIKNGQAFNTWSLEEKRSYLRSFLDVRIYKDKLEIKIKETL